MHDYIETMTLRDQANETLYLETATIKMTDDNSSQSQTIFQSNKVEIKIDDVDHKFHLIYGLEKGHKQVATYHPYYLFGADGLTLPG